MVSMARQASSEIAEALENMADSRDLELARVPSLAAMRDELVDVVREVAAELLPGAPTPRFSPAALQCLLAWPWPGNVAELTRVLAALPGERSVAD
jgi:transcriptional regulator of acetoin/glycerol metabolism